MPATPGLLTYKRTEPNFFASVKSQAKLTEGVLCTVSMCTSHLRGWDLIPTSTLREIPLALTPGKEL